MPKPQDVQQPSLNSVIRARVVRVAAIGLVVRTEDGREGLIREREIAWKPEDREGWRTRFRIGEPIRAVPLKLSTNQRLEFSLRLVDFDPWKIVPERYPVGTLVDGVITSVMSYGVFVELEPGVTGMMHVSTFPTWEKRSPGEIFWPNDQVKAVIAAVNPARRRMELSLREVAERRWQARSTPVPQQPLFHFVEAAKSQRSLLLAVLEQPRQRVLVVEDDPDQRRAVVDWLRHVNQVVEQAGSGEEAIESLSGLQPDLVLMDVGLPGMTGIEAVQRILAERPAPRCIVMTDWGRAEAHAAELSDLAASGVMLMLKPLLPEDLLNALLEATPSIVLPAAKSQARSQIEQIAAGQQPALNTTLHSHLGYLRATTGADKVVLFELDPDIRHLTVSAHSGTTSLHLDALPEVIHSPVSDVAEEGRVYVLCGAHERGETRKRFLQALVEFRTCLGVPVSADLHKRYALFMFSGSETVDSETWLAQARITAGTIGLWLERQHYTVQAASLLRSAMMGQLARGMVHEISGRLTPVNLAIQRLQAACDVLERAAVRSPVETAHQAQLAREELNKLHQQTEALTKTTRSFSRMARSGQEEIVVLKDIVDEAMEVLHDMAATSHVTIFPHPAPRVYLTRAQVTYFQQALVNVLQNAIQQISQFRPDQPGRIEVRLTQTNIADKAVVQVRIEDDGPGIHRRLWERVFEADYTTRPEGSGLGLYISQSLMASQGGRISILDSTIYWGSTFIVELPLKV